jgi:hypothetical protein
MAPVDLKAAELAKLKNKMLEVEAQLREEKKITLKLRDNSEKKIQHIMALDQEIASEVEQFKWKKEKNISDMRFLTDESELKLEDLTEKELFIQHTIAEFDFLVYENEILHNMIKEVSNEQLKTADVQLKEREKKAQMNFDARIEMEDVHRHTIMGFNNEYQMEAVRRIFTSPDNTLCANQPYTMLAFCLYRYPRWSWRHHRQTRRTTVSAPSSTFVRAARMHSSDSSRPVTSA